MTGIEKLGGVLHGVSAVPVMRAPVSSPPFGGILKSIVAETGNLDNKAQQAVTGLLNGSGVDVHEAMIATQKADVAFELALQVRNKAVEAYQQMMGMQF